MKEKYKKITHQLNSSCFGFKILFIFFFGSSDQNWVQHRSNQDLTDCDVKNQSEPFETHQKTNQFPPSGFLNRIHPFFFVFGKKYKKLVTFPKNLDNSSKKKKIILSHYRVGESNPRPRPCEGRVLTN